MAQLKRAAPGLYQAKNKQWVAWLDFRLVFFLCICNLFVAGRQFYIFNLLLPGLVIELGAAFLGLPDYFRKPVLRFVMGRLLVHASSIHAPEISCLPGPLFYCFRKSF
jgi:hypothetical protein